MFAARVYFSQIRLGIYWKELAAFATLGSSCGCRSLGCKRLIECGAANVESVESRRVDDTIKGDVRKRMMTFGQNSRETSSG